VVNVLDLNFRDYCLWAENICWYALTERICLHLGTNQSSCDIFISNFEAEWKGE